MTRSNWTPTGECRACVDRAAGGKAHTTHVCQQAGTGGGDGGSAGGGFFNGKLTAESFARLFKSVPAQVPAPAAAAGGEGGVSPSAVSSLATGTTGAAATKEPAPRAAAAQDQTRRSARTGGVFGTVAREERVAQAAAATRGGSSAQDRAASDAAEIARLKARVDELEGAAAASQAAQATAAEAAEASRTAVDKALAAKLLQLDKSAAGSSIPRPLLVAAIRTTLEHARRDARLAADEAAAAEREQREPDGSWRRTGSHVAVTYEHPPPVAAAGDAALLAPRVHDYMVAGATHHIVDWRRLGIESFPCPACKVGTMHVPKHSPDADGLSREQYTCTAQGVGVSRLVGGLWGTISSLRLQCKGCGHGDFHHSPAILAQVPKRQLLR